MDPKWGEAKGLVRSIHETHVFDRSSAVYIIEEPPGKKTILFKRGRYEVFCPWIYFLVAVNDLGRLIGNHCMMTFFSRRRLEDGVESKLLLPPFSNMSHTSLVCLPPFVAKEAHSPIWKAPFQGIDSFWKSRGDRFEFATSWIPEPLMKGFHPSKDNFGVIYRNWSRLDFRSAMRLYFPDIADESIGVFSSFENLSFCAEEYLEYSAQDYEDDEESDD
jgi:hypothetical protein